MRNPGKSLTCNVIPKYPAYEKNDLPLTGRDDGAGRVHMSLIVIPADPNCYGSILLREYPRSVLNFYHNLEVPDFSYHYVSLHITRYQVFSSQNSRPRHKRRSLKGRLHYIRGGRGEICSENRPKTGTNTSKRQVCSEKTAIFGTNTIILFKGDRKIRIYSSVLSRF